MKTIKNSIAAFATCAAALCSVTAHAEVLTFAFSGNINSMFEHDHASNVNTTVASSTFAGGLVSMGDIVHGTFSYNTDAPLNVGYQPTPPATGTYLVYRPDAAVSQLSFKVGSGPVGFQSGDAPIAIVGNDASNSNGWDIFHLGATNAYDSVMFQNADINLFDMTHTALSSAGMPTSLNLNSFHYKNLHSAWLTRADGNQMHFDVSLTTLTKVATSVPEPETYALMLAGLGLITGVARRRSKQQ
jgi:hypothetical protein